MKSAYELGGYQAARRSLSQFLQHEATWSISTLSIQHEMLVHRRVTSSIEFAGTPFYTWVERGTVRVKCLAQEHSKMCLTWAPNHTVAPESRALRPLRGSRLRN